MPASIFPITKQNVSYNVCRPIPEDRFRDLNEHEKDYSVHEIIVHSPQFGVVTAVAHVANHTDATLAPYDWYHNLVLEGARQNNFPDYYIQQIQGTKVIHDPDYAKYKDAMEAHALLQKLRTARTLAS